MLALAASERVGAFALPRVQDGFATALEAACRRVRLPTTAWCRVR